MEKASVIIPSYNRLNILPKAIESVLSQTWLNTEIIVVDDGSTEDIKTHIKRLFGDKIIYYKLFEKSNANVARNKGVTLSTGEYIAFLDSDDYFLPNHLSQKISVLKQNNVKFVYGSSLLISGDVSTVWQSRNLKPNEYPLDFLLSNGCAPTNSYLMTKEIALKYNWDESLNRHQDFDFFLRVSESETIFCDLTPSSVCKAGEWKNVHFEDCIKFIEKHENKINRQIYISYLWEMYEGSIIDTNNKIYSEYYKKRLLSLSNTLTFEQIKKLYNGTHFIIPFYQYFLWYLKNRNPAIISIALGFISN